jgi:YtoQ family protein
VSDEAQRTWIVYLAGEIHSDWRDRIAAGVEEAGLPVVLTHPVTDHSASDDCGAAILGSEDDKFWHDHKGAGVNAIRTGTLLREADVVVVRFGEKYKQWNAAFDAGQAVALGTPLITLHPPEHDHALKEVDRAALAVAREPEQVVAMLRYAITGRLEPPPECPRDQSSTSRTISSPFRERTLNSRSQFSSSS